MKKLKNNNLLERSVKLIVGLGNPGLKFVDTRHNIGFKILDFLAQKNEVKFKKMMFYSAKVVNYKFDNFCVKLIKPQSFMNNSGDVIMKLMKRYGVDINDLLIVYDDVDLPFGKLRIRKKGSAGSHNGIKSIINSVKSENFSRIRFGIGPKPHDVSMNEHVLGRFNFEEELIIENVLENVADAVESIVLNGIDVTMNRFNI